MSEQQLSPAVLDKVKALASISTEELERRLGEISRREVQEAVDDDDCDPRGGADEYVASVEEQAIRVILSDRRLAEHGPDRRMNLSGVELD